MSVYDIGDLVIMTAQFTDPETGATLVPLAVTCTVLSSDGTTTTTPAVTGTNGVYTAQTLPNRAGRWWYSFDGTGIEAAQESSFVVRSKHVPR